MRLKIFFKENFLEEELSNRRAVSQSENLFLRALWLKFLNVSVL